MKFLKKVIFRKPKLFKRLRAPYRVVLIDDESMDELASFTLTKSKLYMFISTLFVVIITVTVCILLFTPLRYYIPGYGNNKARQQVVKLKQQVDSLRDAVGAQYNYNENIRKVLNGEYTGNVDTTMLDLEKVKREDMNSILPNPDMIKKEAINEVRKQNQ